MGRMKNLARPLTAKAESVTRKYLLTASSRFDVTRERQLCRNENGLLQACGSYGFFSVEWQAIVTAPYDRDLELAVFNSQGPHAIIFPCRRVLRGWINAKMRAPVDVRPTHWTRHGLDQN